MRILAVASAILVGVVTASWGAELQYTFDTVVGSTVTNAGTWGATFDGTLTVKGTVGAAVGVPSVSQWGKNPGGQWLDGLGGNVLHSNTTVGTKTLTFDPNPPGPTKPTTMPPADGVGFFTSEGASPGNNVERDSTISFWLKGGTGVQTGNGMLGIAGSQLFPGGNFFCYNTPTGEKCQNNWWVAVGGAAYGPGINPFTDLANWHFYTLVDSSTWGVGQSRLYRDGVPAAWIEGNAGWSPFTVGLGDGLGLRVGGHDGGNDVFIDNYQFATTLMTDAQAKALFDAQFIPEPTAAMLLLAGAALFGVRRRRN